MRWTRVRSGCAWRLPVVLLMTLLMAEASAADSTTGLHLSGQGQVSVEPDLARVTLQVTREGDDAVALNAEVERVIAAVLELAQEFGLAAGDVTAASLSIQPRRQRRGDDEPGGLSVSRPVQLTIRELKTLPVIVNRSLALGINGVGGIALDSSRRAELEADALALAIADARAEAERVAAGFEVGVGSLLTVHVDGHSPVARSAQLYMESSDGGGAFAPGEIVIRRSIRAQFAIEPR